MQDFSHVLFDFLASFTFSLMKNLPAGRQGNKKSRQNYASPRSTAKQELQQK